MHGRQVEKQFPAAGTACHDLFVERVLTQQVSDGSPVIAPATSGRKLQMFAEPSFFDTAYALRDGIWSGRRDALGSTVEAATLKLARNKLRASAKAALKSSHADRVSPSTGS